MSVYTVSHSPDRRFAGQIKSMLSDADDLSVVTQKKLAESLGVNPLTIQRRLAADGTSWRRLLSEERERRVVRVLKANPKACNGRLKAHTGLSRMALYYLLRRRLGASLTEIRNNPKLLERI